ncbi:peptidase C39 family protein [Streptomyces sp. ODS28]|uniref:peptidase C39 family protein n=1 Tax=Streptomyces sp. ODS28 TaxID=3136688 RepID=UPI0031E96E88
MNHRSATRRTVLAAAVAVAAGTAAAPAFAAGGPGRSGRSEGMPEHGGERGAGGRGPAHVSFHAWSSRGDWQSGEHSGTRAVNNGRAGIVIGTPAGTTEYRDPHTKRTDRWEYATWTSREQTPSVPAGELIASWNAHTPAGTWIKVELSGAYSDGAKTPWYTMGIWTSGDGKDVPRRTSVDGQKDGKSSISTDTFAIDDLASGLRLRTYRLRVTLLRAPGGGATPTVWRLGAMTSDVPDRFTVPASKPGAARGVELTVPRYSQEIHKGQYPEYDNGGEAWCSPTSSQMIIESWGRKPTAADLAWVNPSYEDPQVCHAARYTFDYQYDGCGNWPFNAAYAATYRDMQAVVTRLGSLDDAERLIAARIPVITSQSFVKSELTGAGYGTAGHLMTVIGFTKSGDVIANDPASPSNKAVRRVYKRREFENIWLRTKRKNADGKVVSGTGGVCYLYFPLEINAAQERVLRDVGVL